MQSEIHGVANGLCVYRKFFGAKGAPPTQQTKLSFSTNVAKKEVKQEVDMSADAEVPPEKGEWIRHKAFVDLLTH